MAKAESKAGAEAEAEAEGGCEGAFSSHGGDEMGLPPPASALEGLPAAPRPEARPELDPQVQGWASAPFELPSPSASPSALPSALPDLSAPSRALDSDPSQPVSALNQQHQPH